MDPSVSQVVRVFKEDPLLALLHNETILLVVVKWWKGVSSQVGSLHDWLKDLEDSKLADWDVELLADVLPGINGALSVGKSKLATIGDHHATNKTVTHLETHSMAMVCWIKRENEDLYQTGESSLSCRKLLFPLPVFFFKAVRKLFSSFQVSTEKKVIKLQYRQLRLISFDTLAPKCEPQVLISSSACLGKRTRERRYQYF